MLYSIPGTRIRWTPLLRSPPWDMTTCRRPVPTGEQLQHIMFQCVLEPTASARGSPAESSGKHIQIPGSPPLLSRFVAYEGGGNRPAWTFPRLCDSTESERNSVYGLHHEFALCSQQLGLQAPPLQRGDEEPLLLQVEGMVGSAYLYFR